MINRECVIQQYTEVVDIANWPVHTEYEVFPVGARNKSLRICPANFEYNFCIPNHQYLFKESIKSARDPSKPRHPDQYWAEIIAFKIGRLMGLEVPPAYVALNSETGEAGSLIEWFIGYSGKERFIPGGDYMQAHIPQYDRNKGRQHNLKTITSLSIALHKKGFLSHDWRTYWAQCLAFDAIIGNTDRHQENWGLVWNEKNTSARFSPFFDNGTSLGHELFPEKFKLLCSDSNRLHAYINRGKHHMRWHAESPERLGLIDGVIDYCKQHPSLIEHLIELISWSELEFQRLLEALTYFDVKLPLTKERAEFIFKLTIQRRYALLERLQNEIN